MSEDRQNARPFLPFLLIAVAVIGTGFGGGLLVGWATRERKPQATVKSEPPLSAREAKEALVVCKSELKALAKAQWTPKAVETPGETDDAGLEKAAKVEALRKEVEECRVRETLGNAYVCGTITEQINAYSALAHGNLCVVPAEIGEYLVSSFDKCAEFDDVPAHLDEDELTKSERARIYEAKWNHEDQSKRNLIREIESTLRQCRKTWALPQE
jgi:hypothetical protein